MSTQHESYHVPGSPAHAACATGAMRGGAYTAEELSVMLDEPVTAIRASIARLVEAGRLVPLDGDLYTVPVTELPGVRA